MSYAVPMPSLGSGPSIPLALVPGIARYTPTFTRASVGTVWDSAGVMQTAAVNTPRVGYDPVSHAVRGLLIEAARTNLNLYSADLSNAVYQHSGVNVTHGVASPDGGNNADHLVEDTSTGYHDAAQTYSTNAGDIFAFSVHVKAAENSQFYVSDRLKDANNGNKFSTFVLDLAAQTITNNNPNNVDWYSGLLAAPDSWFRFGWGSTNLYDYPNNGNFFFFNGTGGSYTGDGTSGVFYFGVQREIGPYMSSYIPTTGAPVTRQADIASLNAAWSDKTAGSLLCTFTPEWNQSLLAGEVVLTSQVFDSGDYFAITADASNIYAVLSVGGTLFRAAVAASLAMLTEHWAFASFDGSVLKLTLDGGTIASTATGTTPSGNPTDFGMGHLKGAQQADSWLRNIRYGKSAATDGAMLAADTTGLYPLILDGVLQGVTA